MAANKRQQSKSKFPKLFDWNDSLIESVQKLSYGHGKTGALLARIISELFDRKLAMTFLYHLSNLGFYGEDIWYGFENYCRSDERMFEAVVEIEDKEFYNFILNHKAEEAVRMMKGKKNVT